MGRWLNAVDNADSSVANSAKSANRSDLRTKMPQNIPFGANGTIGTEQKPLTPLAQVAAKSCSPPTNLDRQDWIDFYEERAGILEDDGVATREQAERLAYEACVVALTWALTADYPRDRCTACGNHLEPFNGLPLSDTAVVCDSTCHIDHMRQQRERAERQLAKWGFGLDE